MRYPLFWNPRLAKSAAAPTKQDPLFALHWPIMMKIFLSPGSLKETLDSIKRKNAQHLWMVRSRVEGLRPNVLCRIHRRLRSHA